MILRLLCIWLVFLFIIVSAMDFTFALFQYNYRQAVYQKYKTKLFSIYTSAIQLDYAYFEVPKTCSCNLQLLHSSCLLWAARVAPKQGENSRFIPQTRTLKILSSVPWATDLREVDTCGNITRIHLHEKYFNNNNSILYNNAVNNKQRKHTKQMYHTGQVLSCANNKQNTNRYLVITQYGLFLLLAGTNNSGFTSISWY
jgi:hypothetical protein